jgi:hypothetical protein
MARYDAIAATSNAIRLRVDNASATLEWSGDGFPLAQQLLGSAIRVPDDTPVIPTGLPAGPEIGNWSTPDSRHERHPDDGGMPQAPRLPEGLTRRRGRDAARALQRKPPRLELCVRRTGRRQAQCRAVATGEGREHA